MEFYIDKQWFADGMEYLYTYSTFQVRHSNQNFNNEGAAIRYINHQYPTQLKLGVL